MRLRSLFRSVVLLSALVASFLIGAVVSAKKGWFQPIVTVTVVNQTSQKIERLSLTHKSSRSNGTILLPPLAPGRTVDARFYQAGEGTYTVSALFSDGTSLTSQEAYVEPGYAMTELITATRSQSMPSSGATLRSD